MFLTILTFFITLSVLVLAHELGHFLAAKKTGIKVEEFGFGYPPRIWSKQIGETLWSINAIPFGGFVRLFGEELQESERAGGHEGERTFWAKSKKARTLVILAGVLGNFLLAIVCFSFVYSINGIPQKTNQVKIVGLSPNSPAVLAGLQENDLVIGVDQQPITNLDQFIDLVGQKKGQPINLLIKREDQTYEYQITPRAEVPQDEGPLGVVISDMEIKKYPLWQMPYFATREGFKEALDWGTMILQALKKMVVEIIFQHQLPKDVAGPIGIYQASGLAVKGGIWAIIQFIGILSINLGIINILPLPALDGGRLVFIVYELITKRRPKPVIERYVNAIGMFLIIGLMILITVNDILRITRR